jgi:hypothetical protein
MTLTPDTAESAAARQKRREKIAEIQKREAILLAKTEALKLKNRKNGQLSLSDAGQVRTLSHFGKRR